MYRSYETEIKLVVASTATQILLLRWRLYEAPFEQKENIKEEIVTLIKDCIKTVTHLSMMRDIEVVYSTFMSPN